MVLRDTVGGSSTIELSALTSLQLGMPELSGEDLKQFVMRCLQEWNQNDGKLDQSQEEQNFHPPDPLRLYHVLLNPPLPYLVPLALLPIIAFQCGPACPPKEGAKI